jgi:hypothetical protein
MVSVATGALFTRISTGPNAADTRSKNAATAVSSATSHGSAHVRQPRARRFDLARGALVLTEAEPDRRAPGGQRFDDGTADAA